MSLISSRLDFKSYLKGLIWYHSESLEVLYLGPRVVSYSKQAVVKSFPKYLPIFHFHNIYCSQCIYERSKNKSWFLPEQSFGVFDPFLFVLSHYLIQLFKFQDISKPPTLSRKWQLTKCKELTEELSRFWYQRSVIIKRTFVNFQNS